MCRDTPRQKKYKNKKILDPSLLENNFDTIFFFNEIICKEIFISLTKIVGR